MSTVWVAFDRTNRTEVAIKTISLDAAGWRAEVRDRFMKEARLLARGKHEHLVAVQDVGETDDGYLFLVLELLEGETLAQRLARETRIEWRAAVSLVLGIARGVASLHQAGIVHRDLKPANVVLRQTETGIVPTIIDLGIGKVSSLVGDPELCATLTATGQVLGTPQYMSYEQAIGQTDIDARSDVWALGVILYELLTGARPFEAPNTNAVLAAIRRQNLRPIREVAPDVPAAVVRVVDCCLSTNRTDRYENAEVLAARLADAANAKPDADHEPLRVKPAPRRRKPLLVATGLIVFGTLLIVGMAARSTRPPQVSTQEPLDPSEGTASAPAPTLKVASNASATAPTLVSQPNATPPVTTSAVHKPAATDRNRPPITRVDEAGF